MNLIVIILFLLFTSIGIFFTDGLISYTLFGLSGLVVGSFVAKGLIDTKKDKSDVAGLIKIFAGFGIAVSLFGFLFLIYSATNYTYGPHNQWDLVERITKSDSINSTEQLKEIKKDNFNPETLKFNDETSQTIGIIFTIAGVALGTLGVLWLGHLESTRLRKDREHDQQVQKDRLLSLLSLGIDLFLFIDKKEIDFVYESSDKKYAHTKYNSIAWQDKYFFLLTKENVKDDTKLKLAYEKHLTSLYQFLYLQKNFQKSSILKDVEKIIEELKIIYYEKDILLYLPISEKKSLSKENIEEKEKNYEKKRDIFIRLLKQFNDYNNFLSGNTNESDFGVSDYEVYDKKLSTLISANEDNSKNPIDYLKEKFDRKEKAIFYNYFVSKISKEFTELYLIKESNIFSIFQINEIKDIFEMMRISNLDAMKFFNSYFSDSFKKYIENKRVYVSNIDLNQSDLEFDEYRQIIENAFRQIQADISSVKELYSLFYSFIILYNEYSSGDGDE